MRTLSEKAYALYMEALRNIESKHQFRERISYSPMDYVPPCIESLLEGVSKGERNTACFVLSCFLKQQRRSMLSAKSVLLRWNNLNNPPLPQREIENTLRSVYRGNYSVGCSTHILSVRCAEERCLLRKRLEGSPG